MRSFLLDDALCARLGVSPVSALSPDSVTVSAQTVRAPPSGYDPALADRDPLFQAMARLGLVIGGPRRTDMGWTFDLICPWVHEHTLRATTGTAYAPGVERFKCQHGHCIDRTPGDLKPRLDEMLREDSHGLVGLAQIAGEVEFDVVDPATVPLPDQLIRRETKAERDFFARFVYLRPKDAFWDMDRQIQVENRDIERWTSALHNVLPDVGTERAPRKLAPHKWFLRDPRGRCVDGLIDWPGQPEIVRESGQVLANRWQPLPRPLARVREAEVDATAVAPWLELFWHVIGQGTLEAWELGETVLDWLALVQTSHIKGGWHVLLAGGQHGSGKDMIVQPLVRALGRRAETIRGETLANPNYNPWEARRLGHMIEVRQTTRGISTSHDTMGRLKGALDRGKDWVTISDKYTPIHRARNTLMAWIVSNEDNPLRLESGDRRFLVIDCSGVAPWVDAKYLRLAHWLEQEGGDARVVEFLHRRWETMPDARQHVLLGVAPLTNAKRALITMNEHPVVSWLRQMIADDELPDVVSVSHLSRRLLEAQRDGWFGAVRLTPTPVQIGLWLKQVGALKLYNGEAVRLKNRRERVWVLRNQDFYKLLGEPDIAKYCDETQPEGAFH